MANSGLTKSRRPGLIASAINGGFDLATLRREAERFEGQSEIRNPHVESPVSQATKQSAKPSSVLIAITDEASPRVLLTRRHAGIRFGGHLCFPGGRAEPGETVIETALRESEEEIGLKLLDVEVLGSFGHYFTQAGYRIDPIVGIVAPDINYQPEPSEVEEIHWISFNEMLTPDRYVLTQMNASRAYFGFDTDEIHIGGPTVSLMIGLLEVLGRA